MADHTGIEWADATWNPIVGCEIVSPGCTHCYAMRFAAARLDGNPNTPHYAGTTKRVNGNAVWTGKIALAPDHIITQPLRWKKPRVIFVNSMGDIAANGVNDEMLDRIFAVMAICKQHTFLVLTKRPDRLREYLEKLYSRDGREMDERLGDWAVRFTNSPCADGIIEERTAPLENVWIGTSAEDQPRADERIPQLLATLAAKRFVSIEPMLGAISLTDLRKYNPARRPWIDALRGITTRGGLPTSPDECGIAIESSFNQPRLDWVIVGGESGAGARPMHPDWARDLRDQCAGARVPFFFKQWGEWHPHGQALADSSENCIGNPDDNERWHTFDRGGYASETAWRVGKRAAGRLLDGVEHNGRPA